LLQHLKKIFLSKLRLSLILGLISSLISFIFIKVFRETFEDEIFEQYVVITSVISWILPFVWLRKDIFYASSGKLFAVRNVLKISFTTIGVAAILLLFLLDDLVYSISLIIVTTLSITSLFNAFYLSKKEIDKVAFFRLVNIVVTNMVILICFYTFGNNLDLYYLLGTLTFSLFYSFIYFQNSGHNFFRKINSEIESSTKFTTFNTLSTFFYLTANHFTIILITLFFNSSESADFHILSRIMAFPIVSISSTFYNRNLGILKISSENNKKIFDQSILWSIILYLFLLILMNVIGNTFFSINSFSLMQLILFTIMFNLKFIFNSWIPILYKQDLKMELILALLILLSSILPIILINDFNSAINSFLILEIIILLIGVSIMRKKLSIHV